jgi:hypothetical protein
MGKDRLSRCALSTYRNRLTLALHSLGYRRLSLTRTFAHLASRLLLVLSIIPLLVVLFVFVFFVFVFVFVFVFFFFVRRTVLRLVVRQKCHTKMRSLTSTACTKVYSEISSVDGLDYLHRKTCTHLFIGAFVVVLYRNQRPLVRLAKELLTSLSISSSPCGSRRTVTISHSEGSSCLPRSIETWIPTPFSSLFLFLLSWSIGFYPRPCRTF